MSNKVLFGVVLVIVVFFGAVFVKSKPTPQAPQAKVVSSLASLNTGSAPWPFESAHLPDRLKAINIPLLGAEGNAKHIHSHLDIYLHGKQTAVAANAGFGPQGGISPLHTHDATGIIHVESPDAAATFRLDQFFDIWGVKFTDTSIGSYANDSANTLAVYDNGKLVPQPVKLELAAHHEIVVTYGTPQEQPASIAKNYSFPDGL